MKKQSEGLGIKVMKNLNQSLIAKSSWSEMIRCKYLKGRSLAECLSDKCNGCDVLFYTDFWVPNIGPLQTYAFKKLDQNQITMKVCGFINEEMWNYNLLFLCYLWKWRCCKVFEENFCIPLEPNKVILRAVKKWMDSCKKEEANIDRNCHQIAWQPLLNSWVKVNVDGSGRGTDGFITAEGVIRDSGKNWLKRFATKKGYNSVLEAKI
ncbi:hypothetical protein ACOSP7_027159 [Xanthoceras sorbifolium]